MTQLASKDGALEPRPWRAASVRRYAGLALCKSLTADAPGRKITYKAMKAGRLLRRLRAKTGRKFYRRYARGAEAARCAASFSSIPASRAEELDRVTLAIANAFDPFPTGPRCGDTDRRHHPPAADAASAFADSARGPC